MRRKREEKGKLDNFFWVLIFFFGVVFLDFFGKMMKMMMVLMNVGGGWK